MPPEFVELSAARAWGLTPAQWREQSDDDKARMMAQVQFGAAYDGWVQDVLIEKEKKDSDARPVSQPENSIFAAMKARLRGDA